MEAQIQERLDGNGQFKSGLGPRYVALGPDGSYIYIADNSGGFWNLKGQDENLNEYLKERPNFDGLVCYFLLPFSLSIQSSQSKKNTC